MAEKKVSNTDADAMPRRFPTDAVVNVNVPPDDGTDADAEQQAGETVMVKRDPNDPHFTYTKIGDSLDVINPLTDTTVKQSPTPKSGAVTEGSSKTPADPKFDR